MTSPPLLAGETGRVRTIDVILWNDWQILFIRLPEEALLISRIITLLVQFSSVRSAEAYQVRASPNPRVLSVAASTGEFLTLSAMAHPHPAVTPLCAEQPQIGIIPCTDMRF